MKERPILFSTEMVKAILQGRKTQTRRIVKPQPIGKVTYFKGEIWTDEPDVITSRTIKCPYGQPNDRLWVRETWARESFPNGTTARSVETLYLANGDKAVRWKPSIHMPKAAARIWLEVVSVRVERLNDISEKDAIAEGIELLPIYSFPI